MANFDEAVAYILAREQGIVESEFDAGGITNYGISLRFLRELPIDHLRKYGIFGEVTEETIRDLTEDQAKIIYRGEFWDEKNFVFILSQKLCNYFFDCVVNCGVSQAVKLLQRAVCAAFVTRSILRDDGLFGERTIKLINSLDDKILLQILVGLRDGFYRLLVEVNPKDKPNLEGWLNRTYNVF